MLSIVIADPAYLRRGNKIQKFGFEHTVMMDNDISCWKASATGTRPPSTRSKKEGAFETVSYGDESLAQL